MKVVMKYKVNQNVSNPIFGIGIHTIDHINCYGTNTFIDQVHIKELIANEFGEVSFIIDSLDLVANTYLITAAVHDSNGNQYDYHDKRFSFKVSSVVNEVGIVKLKHKWKVDSYQEDV